MLASRTVLDARFKKLLALEAMDGGGGGASAALPRFRFIAGDTTQTANNGAIGEPYKTIGQFDTAFATSASVADANSPVVAFITPALGGYTEDIVVPPRRQIEYRADNFATVLTGDVTWDNVAGPGTHDGTTAFCAFHNPSIVGNVTCTDDGGGGTGILLFAGDEQALGTSTLNGNIDTTGCTKLGAIGISNWLINGTIDCGTDPTSARVTLVSMEQIGDVTALSLQIFDSIVASSALTVGAPAGNVIQNTLFVSRSATVITGDPGSTLSVDGTSWRSFLEAGGTVAAGGIVVLVVGGYSGAPINGADIGNEDAAITLNGTNAGATWAAGGNRYEQSAAITANHTIRFRTGGGELVGDTMRVVRDTTDANGFHLTFTNEANATLAVLAGANRGFVEVVFDGSDWELNGGGGGLT